MRYVLYIALLLCVEVACAQSDTTFLEAVEVTVEPLSTFATGGELKVHRIEDGQHSLQDVLSDESALYFKSYGFGQLATITLRGTSATHTNVLWHGVPAIYPSLGQMDFSQWPAWLMSSVSVREGSAGALVGSGAIGGSVIIDEQTDAPANGAQVKAGFGSFGQSFYGAKATYGDALKLTTKVFRSSAENDFTYKYDGEDVTQQNAAIEEWGIQQQLNWRVKNTRFWVDGMYTTQDREIQPTKWNIYTNETLVTENLRTAAGFVKPIDSLLLTTTVAYLHNSTLYVDTVLTAVNQFTVLSEIQRKYKKLTYRFGLNANGFSANARNYQKDFLDWRAHLYASGVWTPSEVLQINVNLRQSFYQSAFPFTPDLGVRWALINQKMNHWFVGASYSRGFRFPTLNERYWQPGGNPDLKPEQTNDWTVYTDWQKHGKFLSVEQHLSAYFIDASQWIYWQPTNGYTSPKNIRDVHVWGVSYKGKLLVAVGDWEQSLSAGVNVNFSLNQTGSEKGNQMIYVPRYLGRGGYSVKYAGWKLAASADYTSTRFTDNANMLRFSLDPFWLFEASVSKTIHFKYFQMDAGIKGNNLANKSFELVRNYAMPGRNYELYLIIKL